MAACLNNSAIIDFVKSLAKETEPHIFHEPTRKEEKIRKMIEEVEELLKQAA